MIVSDLPGPGDGRGITYQSEEFYGLAADHLAPGGRLAVRGGPAGPGLWSAEAGVRTTGLQTVPYEAATGPKHCPRSPDAPETFILAARDQPELTLATDTPPPRSVTTDDLRTSADHLAARRPDTLPAPRTLLG